MSNQIAEMLDRVTQVLSDELVPGPRFDLSQRVQSPDGELYIVGYEWGPRNWVNKNEGQSWAYHCVWVDMTKTREPIFVPEAKLLAWRHDAAVENLAATFPGMVPMFPVMASA